MTARYGSNLTSPLVLQPSAPLLCIPSLDSLPAFTTTEDELEETYRKLFVLFTAKLMTSHGDSPPTFFQCLQSNYVSSSTVTNAFAMELVIFFLISVNVNASVRQLSCPGSSLGLE
jgi:hypothetical protein